MWATVGIVYSGADPSGDPSTERSPDVWEQLQNQINELKQQGADADAIKQAVEAYMAANPPAESDPTVPEWAKQPQKPKYTASEVGALASDELQNAVNVALAQAKDSGQFDGPAGPQGEEGPAGADGKDGQPGADGKDYVLTEADKTEIAEQAAGMVEVPESGGIEVTGASVGQTIVVKAVDDNGKPTEWETADLPQGGGGSAGWTKRTITLEEAVSQISFELPSAKKMFVVLYLHVNDKDNSLNTGNDICMMKVNESMACRFECYTRQSVKFGNVIDFEKVGSHIKLIRTNQYPNSPVWNSQETMYMSGWQPLKNKTETINTVRFVLNGANLLFHNDSYLEVYYQ